LRHTKQPWRRDLMSSAAQSALPLPLRTKKKEWQPSWRSVRRPSEGADQGWVLADKMMRRSARSFEAASCPGWFCMKFLSKLLCGAALPESANIEQLRSRPAFKSTRNSGKRPSARFAVRKYFLSIAMCCRRGPGQFQFRYDPRGWRGMSMHVRVDRENKEKCNEMRFQQTD
jgi:hypothetical protein